MMASRYFNFDSDFFNKYATLTYYLSRGAAGNVYGPIQWNDMQLAIKQATFADGEVTDKFKKDIEVKKDIWTSLEHKHLTRIHAVDLSELPKAMFIVMEFGAGGSLSKTLRSLGPENKLQIDVITDWAKQIAEGMRYLHERNIVHRDLKSLNILLMEPFDILNSRTMITLKIADFDEVKEHDHTATMSFVGTFAYMAPEVLKNQWFSKASDVWSYGVVMWEMLSGDIPHKDSTGFLKKSQDGTLDNLPLEQSFPEDYKLLLKRCWESTCGNRPSFAEIFSVLQRMAQGEDITEILKYRENMLQKHSQDKPEVSDEAAENEDSITDETKTEDEDVTNKQSQNDRYVLDDFRDPHTSLPKVPEICGLAILDQEVFILRRQRSRIEVYDSIKFHFKRRMGMNDPEDIASCSVNKCLYVSERGYHSKKPSIIKIDPTTGKTIKDWQISRGGRISIASDTNVILNINYEALLFEYTADGKLIRKIELGTDISEARHAIKLPNGLFVVCQGDYDDPVRRVCLLATKATTRDRWYGTDEVQILKEFCQEVLEGESVDSLWRPRYLSVDKEGSILVLDGSNNRAVLLSSNLDKPQIIISEKDGMKILRRTCFNESTGVWFVADDHHVMVCRVKDEKVERKPYSLISP